MAEEILHIVAKNPEKKHVTSDVSDTGVQKQAGDQREKCSDEIDVPSKKSREARGNGGVGHQKRFGQVWRQRDFVQENRDVCADQQSIDDREPAVRVKIFEWNEHEEPRSE